MINTFTLEKIVQTFIPNYKYRISEHSYTKGTRFEGTQKNGKVYILKGTCQYSFEERIITLEEQKAYNLPEGEYSFEALSNVTLVKVWELPKELWNN